MKLISNLPEILILSSFPPRECGIATYTSDLIEALNYTFSNSFDIKVIAVQTGIEKYDYSSDIYFVLTIENTFDYVKLLKIINDQDTIKIVLIQHEFGLYHSNEEQFLLFIQSITKKVIIAFHTVLPQPNFLLNQKVNQLFNAADEVIVMTKSAANILIEGYNCSQNKITIIPHGTHYKKRTTKAILKNKYHLSHKTVLATFGLIGPGKSIETTLISLPDIVAINDQVIFLIIGKTHPTILKNEGEEYRNTLMDLVHSLKLEKHVKFINQYLPTQELLEYLQLTDIYLFTSKDPYQAVSGTFSYAMSCGCLIVSTPIPHAIEVQDDLGVIIIDFENSEQLSNAVSEFMIRLSADSGYHNTAGISFMTETAWENSAIAHGNLFQKMNNDINLHFTIPPINLEHLIKMTTSLGIVQFSNFDQPDLNSGYTLDDNARALIVFCQHYQLKNDPQDLKYILIYLNFIQYCCREKNGVLNYVDKNQNFTEQNAFENLEDAKGRAIWALGYVLSLQDTLPFEIILKAEQLFNLILTEVKSIRSTRSMAFVIKGLYYKSQTMLSEFQFQLLDEFSNHLVQMYFHEMDDQWKWFESYLTYANSLLPEALLCAWIVTERKIYKEVALYSFDFLLNTIFTEKKIQVISNKGWLFRENQSNIKIVGGQQPIDVSYTIMSLIKFYQVFTKNEYKEKIEIAFSWFLGNNHLSKFIYNSKTGGCSDGLEENNVNLNQGAESTLTYLLARLELELMK